MPSIMEAPESAKVIFQRVMELDPEYAIKVLGHILLQYHGEQARIRLAFAPDVMIKSVIEETKQTLKLSPITVTSNPNLPPKDKQVVVSGLPTKFSSFESFFSHFAPCPELNNSQIEKYTPTYQTITNNHNENVPFSYFSSPLYGFSFHNQSHSSPLESQNDHDSHSGNFKELETDPKPNTSQVSRLMKFCKQFNKGDCKYGGTCRFLHCMRLTNDFIMIVNWHDASEVVKEYHVLSHKSVQKLEMEIYDILKYKGMDPVPVSILLNLYRERYGRKLEVTGYYTENYMQGKVVCDLNELLIHLPNSIRLIQRYGEICVILAEKFQKFLKCNDEQDQGLAISLACKVYVTFHPESAFTKNELYDYFKTYGPVKFVRIPDQFQRMYGFVTFVHPLTATVVLSKGNPHLIGGRRLLVKPYQVDNRKSSVNRYGGNLTGGISKYLTSKTQTTRPSESVHFVKKQPIVKEHDQLAGEKKNYIWKVKVTCSSSHNSSNNAMSPREPGGCFRRETCFHCSKGVCSECARKGKGVVTRDC